MIEAQYICSAHKTSAHTPLGSEEEDALKREARGETARVTCLLRRRRPMKTKHFFLFLKSLVVWVALSSQLHDYNVFMSHANLSHNSSNIVFLINLVVAAHTNSISKLLLSINLFLN
jgi:hypothetical protein